MATPKINFAKQNKLINNLAKNIQSGIDSIYVNTYFSQSQNSKDLETTKDAINTSMDKIVSNNLNNVGIPNLSQLYTRLEVKKMQNDAKSIKEIEDVFNDNVLMDNVLTTYSRNKYYKDLDDDIDTICKYMPQLEEALSIKKDNILSADHFSKDFLTIVSDNADEKTTFNNNIKELKSRYNLLEKLEEYYDHAARYGEEFVYIVPYTKALNRLIKNREANGGIVNESCTLDFSAKKIISESTSVNFTNNEIPDFSNSKNDKNPEFKFKVSCSGVLESVLLNYVKVENAKNNLIMESTVSWDDTIPNDKLKIPDEDKNSSEGFIDINKNKSGSVKLQGAIIKRLKRERVIPIYIEDACLGYYYLECQDEIDPFNGNQNISDPLYGNKALSKNFIRNDDSKKDELLKFISMQMAQYLDAKFINSNQDLKKEIYLILKYDEQNNQDFANNVKITFLPPDDVVHMYFEKDSDTHRGKSDLEKSLLPATLYSSLYITNTLGIMTRGQDKRVYYVKQNIDTNISKTLLNTINQIKKGNFGARELANMKYILNITGRFNDYIVPKSASGDVPIEFELMPGQNIEIKTELMTMLEQMAVNSTDVPFELIQLRQSVDYALQLSMTNSKFLRYIFKRQSKVQKIFTEIISKLYKYEFGDDISLMVTLPPPAFLNITNTSTMITNNDDFVSKIVELETTDNNSDRMKLLFKKKLSRYYLSTFLDYDTIDRIKQQAENEASKEETGNDE